MATDDFDDRPARVELGPLDKTFRDTNIVVLILFSLCCGIIAFALGLVGMLTAKDPKAKANATVVTIISGILTAVGVVLQITGAAAGFVAGGGGR